MINVGFKSDQAIRVSLKSLIRLLTYTPFSMVTNRRDNQVVLFLVLSYQNTFASHPDP